MNAKVIVKSIIINPRLKRLLLIRRSSGDDTGAGTWENAGGNVEDGEQLEQAMAREIREETGLTEVRIERVVYASLFESRVMNVIIAYLCFTDAEQVSISNEHSEYVWADEQMCRSLLPQGIIDDFDKNGIFKHLR